MRSPESHLNYGDRYDFSLVVDDFESATLRPQIPGYDTMRERVSHIIDRFLAPGDLVLDLGCSRGETFLHFLRSLSADRRMDICQGGTLFLGVDSEPLMIDSARERIREYMNSEGTNGYSAMFIESDMLSALKSLPSESCQLATAILSIQFTPPEDRAQILSELCRAMVKGGVFVVVEKIVPEKDWEEELLRDLYHDLKAANGMTRETIVAKEKALEGVMFPMSGRENETMLCEAGFSHVARFWQDLQFAGYIAIKPFSEQ